MYQDLDPSQDLLAVLPDDACRELISLLQAKDLACLCLAKYSFAKIAQSRIQHFFQQEELPGTGAADLFNHYTKLEDYQNLLLNELIKIIPGLDVTDYETQPAKLACRRYLEQAILNFTKHLSGFHSWNKHLPIGESVEFEFFMDLTANMHYCSDKKSAQIFVGDTWLPIDKYHSTFGFFDYCKVERTRTLKARTLSDEQYFIPISARGPTVNVTAALKPGTPGHSLYSSVLRVAVEARDPELVYGTLSKEMYPYMNSRFNNENDLRLPAKAAETLEQMARTLIEQVENGQDVDYSIGNEAVVDQSRREKRAIAFSLWEFCLRNFGPEYTPDREDLCKRLTESLNKRKRQS